MKTNRPDVIADSTIALTAFNVLSMSSRPLYRQALLKECSKYHPGLNAAQLERALDGLQARRWIDVVGSETIRAFSSKDGKRLIVIDRDRSEAEVAKGVHEGGWATWRVRGANGSLVPIDKALEVTK
jgi:hypothetical protein